MAALVGVLAAFGAALPAQGTALRTDPARAAELVELEPLSALERLVAEAPLHAARADDLRSSALRSLDGARRVMRGDVDGGGAPVARLLDVAADVRPSAVAAPATLGGEAQPASVAGLLPLVEEWFTARGLNVPPDTGSELRKLDELPLARRAAALRVITDYLVLDALARAEYGSLPVPVGTQQPAPPATASGAMDLRAVDELSRWADGHRPVTGAWGDAQVLTSQDRLARSLADLSLASETSVPAPDVVVAPLLSLRWGDTSDTYTRNFGLLVDAGGDDTYLNNAGGSAVVVTGLTLFGCPVAVGAGALLDRAGNDSYSSGRSCGVNGGAFMGSGLLIDEAGSDRYVAGDNGTNGSAFIGSGLIIDAAGSDEYVGGRVSNGSAQGHLWTLDRSVHTPAAGAIVDGAGDDVYRARPISNASTYLGVAALVDLAGSDRYTVGNGQGNGVAFLGTATLVDREGNDVYETTDQPVLLNNGGSVYGVGVLVDGSGDDRYASLAPLADGAAILGVGILADLAGDDVRSSPAPAQNGVGFGLALGVSMDAQGNDEYTAGIYSNGFGVGLTGSIPSWLMFLPAAGVLIDGSGDDDYAGAAPSNGRGLAYAGPTPGIGLLVDAHGADTYGDDGTVDCSRASADGARVDLTGACMASPQQHTR